MNAQETIRPSVAIVSPRLENDPFTFLKAAKYWEDTLKTDLFGLSGEGKLPQFSVQRLQHYNLVIFEALGARVSLLKPQLDSLKAITQVLFLGTPLAQGNVDLADYPKFAAYWDNGNLYNYKGMLSYLAGSYFKLPVEVQPLRTYPESGFYYPGSDRVFADAGSYLNWYTTSYPKKINKDQPKIGIAFYQSYFVKRDVLFIDSLISYIEEQGAVPVAYMSESGFLIDSVFRVDQKPVIDVLLYGGMFLNFKDPEKGRSDASRLNVPILEFNVDYYNSRAEWERTDKSNPQHASRFYFTERDGVYEPMTIAGTDMDSTGVRKALPIDYQVKWRVERALAWAKLRKLPNKDKRVIITYYSEGNSQADVGADIDAYLDVPSSLVNLLYALKDSGYNTGPNVQFVRDSIAQKLAVHGSNVPPGDILALKRKSLSGPVIRIPKSQYLKWFQEMPKTKQQQVIQRWGPAPGKIMTRKEKDGKQYFVFPVTRYGNIILAPHPNWGVDKNPDAIYSTEALVPSHAYLAFYFWMQKKLDPAAFISFFTQLSLMPGKEEGPSRKDWNGILLGDIPHISLVPLIAGGGRGNKRKTNALTIDYLTEITRAGLSDSLQLLRDEIQRWNSTADPPLKSILEDTIDRYIRQQELGQDLGWKDKPNEPVADGRIRSVEKYLDHLARQTIPHGSHILGQKPDSIIAAEMIAGMLGQKYLKRFKGNEKQQLHTSDSIIKNWLAGTFSSGTELPVNFHDSDLNSMYQEFNKYHKALDQTPMEITQLLNALNGYYIPPGPGNDPMRDPDALPSGRNPYTANDKMIPSKAAWVLGKKMGNDLLNKFREKHGESAFPKKVGFVLWSSDITQTQGVTEAEILYLIGIRPIWNNRGQVMDMELIPSRELGHPRIDVLITTSGTYRDHFRSNIVFLDKAIQLAAKSPEADNYIALNSRRYKYDLKLDSTSRSNYRIFSSNMGTYSTNLEFAGDMQDRPDSTLPDFYVNRMGYAYGDHVNAMQMSQLFQANIKDLEAAAFNRSSSVYGIMDHPMVAAYFGAYSLASNKKGEPAIDMFINNLQPNETPHVGTLEKSLRTELRTRYFSSKWIKAMMAHGYDGTRYMNEFSHTLFLWNITNKEIVQEADWGKVYDTYIADTKGLGLKEYFEKYNPAARQEMAEALTKAGKKGFWAPGATRQAVLDKYAAQQGHASVMNPEDVDRQVSKKTKSGRIGNDRGGEISGLGQLPAGKNKGGKANDPSKANVPTKYMPVTGQQIEEQRVKLPISPIDDSDNRTKYLQIFYMLLFLSAFFIWGWRKVAK